MTEVGATLRFLARAALWPVDRLPPAAGLTLFAVVSGVLMLWVVGKTTPQRALETARDRMTSSIYEMRLFLDSPRRLLAAQARLLWWSLRYLACLAPAFLVLGPPLALLYPQLEIRCGLAPLPVGAPAVARVQLAPGVDGAGVYAEGVSEGARVTAPPLYLEDERAVYLRVEPTAAGEQALRLHVGGREIEKRLSAAGSGPVSRERRAGLATAWTFGIEAPLPDDAGVESIVVTHPPRPQRWLGLPVPWWLYWLGLATVSALALRGRLGVAI